MDDAIPSISTAGVGSRFVSQAELEDAKAKRDEQWKAAYARLGQEPPPQPTDDAYDGRSLAEKLAANRAAKQEEWEERNKLGEAVLPSSPNTGLSVVANSRPMDRKPIPCTGRR
ncbi:hypothetical protein C8Q73DRAFT_683558 [Cubamyces lactineus]|nr:hypothetical protein C8Q73DRAFT_683558 [Cubamyces lactineus]